MLTNFVIKLIDLSLHISAKLFHVVIYLISKAINLFLHINIRMSRVYWFAICVTAVFICCIKLTFGDTSLELDQISNKSTHGEKSTSTELMRGNLKRSDTSSDGDDTPEDGSEEDDMDEAIIQLMRNPEVRETFRKVLKMGFQKLLANSSTE